MSSADLDEDSCYGIAKNEESYHGHQSIAAYEISTTQEDSHASGVAAHEGHELASMAEADSI